MIVKIDSKIRKLIREGQKLRGLAGDMYGVKTSLVSERSYVSWRQRCLSEIKNIGSTATHLVHYIEKYPNSLFPYDDTIDLILGNLDAALELSNNIDMKRSKEMGKNVFIVHGHDEVAKYKVAHFIERLGLTPIILHEKPNKGKTLLEKVLEHSANCAYAIALLTPDDKGYSKKTPKAREQRARQNVIFELGLFIGALGRQKVAVLTKDAVETPSDLKGLLYIPFDDANGWKLELANEMKTIFGSIDLNKLI